MCTVSILPTENGYLIGGNRDELKTRPKARPPSVSITKGIRYISPTDTQAGGTWIAVNEKGLAACLLNRYTDNFEQDFGNIEPISRGTIIPTVISAKTIREALDLFKSKIEPDSFRPFTLLLFNQESELIAHRIDWNGKELKIKKDISTPTIFVSSGKMQSEVAKVRTEIFKHYLKSNDYGLELVKLFHTHKIPDNGAFSVAMMQEMVQTVSCTIIQVGENISMDYTDGLPSEDSEWSTHKL